MLTRQVIRICLSSRLKLTILAIVSDLLFPDHRADAYQNELLTDYFENRLSNLSTIDQFIAILGKPLARWDAQYFLTIALKKGYPEEAMLAFLPGYPFVVRSVALVLQSLTNYLPVDICFISTLVISSYLVNLACFVIGGYFLLQLTWIIFQNPNFAFDVMKIYAYNPASIFFTAFYTESLFSSVTFSALYLLYRKQSVVGSSVLLAIATATRSNGLVAFGYIAFYQVIRWIDACTSREWRAVCSIPLATLASALLVTFPFFTFQVYAYQNSCETLPNTVRPEWCTHTLPLSYSSVQRRYWNVGFLNYYQLKQIPNFLLATPILVVVLWISVTYLSRCEVRKTLMQARSGCGLSETLLGSRRRVSVGEGAEAVASGRCLPFAIHSAALALLCLTSMNVQVATRFLLSSGPWPYWAICHILNKQLLGPHTTSLIPLWQGIYFALGTCMFANFLPFT